MKGRAAGDRVGDTDTVRVPAGNRANRKGIFRAEGRVKGNPPKGWCWASDWQLRGALSAPSQRARERAVTGTQKLYEASLWLLSREAVWGLQLLASHWLQLGDAESGPKAGAGEEGSDSSRDSSHGPWGFSFCRAEFEQG